MFSINAKKFFIDSQASSFVNCDCKVHSYFFMDFSTLCWNGKWTATQGSKESFYLKTCILYRDTVAIGTMRERDNMCSTYILAEFMELFGRNPRTIKTDRNTRPGFENPPTTCTTPYENKRTFVRSKSQKKSCVIFHNPESDGQFMSSSFFVLTYYDVVH